MSMTGFMIHELRNYREKIYISYDSTNKNCQAGDIKMVEFGHPKVDMGEPVFNYAVAYDTCLLYTSLVRFIWHTSYVLE